MAIDAHIASLRQSYAKSVLLEQDAALNPFDQFAIWWQQVLAAQIYEPNAMSISTINEMGYPESRIVLLKSFDTESFTFFTNYESKKGKALSLNNKAHLLFFWPDLERQVRIMGHAEKIEEQYSEQYFKSRPKASQVGAWASKQSAVIENRAELEAEFLKINEQYKDQDSLPKPNIWGGYRVVPVQIEFWQGRESRLHDRLQYTLAGNEWSRVRLNP